MMDVLCIDKTGTITMNKLSIANALEFGNHKKEEVLLYGALASQKANQDPIDLVFIAFAEEKGLKMDSYIQRKFEPFDPSTRRTEVIIEKDGEQFRIAKGAVSVIASLCGIKSNELDALEKRIEVFTNKGYRTLAVAIGSGSSRMELVGIAALYDMPRPDSAKLISKLKSLGISTKMLTGDSLSIAKEIARETNFGEKITGMTDLKEMENIDPTKISDLVENSNGFAEVYPEDKYQIIKNLQAKKHMVGMTGDGINDAAALKQAEVGIAVSNSTDVAKGAASVVLTTEGLSNIVDLVWTGRMIYQRMVTWILNKVVKTFEIVLFVVLAFLSTGLYVVGAFEIVLLLFLIDFVTIAISTDNVRPSEKPETWNISLLVNVAVLLGIFLVVESLGLLYIGLNFLDLSNTSALNTFVFDMLLFGGMFTIFVVRERSNFWKSRPSNTLIIAILGDILITSIISILGIPGLTPIRAEYIFINFGWYFVFGLLVNDQLKARAR